MQSKIVILGTGGTIAGTAASATDTVGYRSAQLGVAQLLAAVPPLATPAAGAIECEQVAQFDSKDMDHATWQRLAQRCGHHLARADVAGVVVTHGTDRWRAAPSCDALGPQRIQRDAADWPRVEIVLNHVGAGGALVDVLVEQGMHGIVAAGTGNGTLHRNLEAALLRAQAQGVHVLRASRCAAGPVLGNDSLPSAGRLTAVQARIELLLKLLGTA